jgi:hypothetical protein
MIPDYNFNPSKFEIAEIITIPVKAFLENGCRREEPGIILGGKTVIPYVYSYKENAIIGATARIVKQFLDIFKEISGCTKS